MRLLSRAQLRRRLATFALLSLVFTVAVWITEVTIRSFDGVTPWTAFAALLVLVSFLSMLRWSASAREEVQTEWQPALMFRVLGAGIGFQMGVIGYFVANDVIAASVGCAGFLFVLAYAIRSVGSVAFEASA